MCAARTEHCGYPWSSGVAGRVRGLWVLVRVLLWVTVTWRCSTCEGSSRCTVVLGALFCMYMMHQQKEARR